MKREEIERDVWPALLREFDERNRLRPVRLGVMSREGLDDYWLGDGLPLTGLSLEPEGEDAPRIELMLGGGAGTGHMTHAVRRVRRVTRILADGGADEGLEVEGADGLTTILRFEAARESLT